MLHMLFMLHIQLHKKQSKMQAKIILFNYTNRKPGFKIVLTENGKRSYQSIDVPFSVNDWNYDPKKRRNELKKRMPSHKEYNQYIRNRKFVEATEAKYQDVINDFINIGAEFTAA